MKRTLKKASVTRIDTAMALLVLRSTPIDCHLLSPAEIPFGRKLRTDLPVKIRDERGDYSTCQRLLQRQFDQLHHYETPSVRQLTSLDPYQHVRVRDHVIGTWQPAVVKETCSDMPMSYQVEMQHGSVLRRNRRHVRTTGERH